MSTTPLTAAQRRLRSQIAADESWARTPDRSARTAAARRAADARFEKMVDPDGVLTVEERGKRAANARRAHYRRMALQSARARARQKPT